ncbi:hypothetical protein ACRRTK_005659 [Alexandromys fortis]
MTSSAMMAVGRGLLTELVMLGLYPPFHPQYCLSRLSSLRVLQRAGLMAPVIEAKLCSLQPASNLPLHKGQFCHSEGQQADLDPGPCDITGSSLAEATMAFHVVLWEAGAPPENPSESETGLWKNRIGPWNQSRCSDSGVSHCPILASSTLSAQAFHVLFETDRKPSHCFTTWILAPMKEALHQIISRQRAGFQHQLATRTHFSTSQDPRLNTPLFKTAHSCKSTALRSGMTCWQAQQYTVAGWEVTDVDGMPFASVVPQQFGCSERTGGLTKFGFNSLGTCSREIEAAGVQAGWLDKRPRPVRPLCNWQQSQDAQCSLAEILTHLWARILETYPLLLPISSAELLQAPVAPTRPRILALMSDTRQRDWKVNTGTKHTEVKRGSSTLIP